MTAMTDRQILVAGMRATTKIHWWTLTYFDS
jgi:hypothetical protein